jgi:hypothetical protein
VAPAFEVRRTLRAGAVAALLGLAVTAVAIAVDPKRALLAYLAAYAAVAAAAIGALVLLLVGYVANARWLAPLRRVQEALACVFPLLALLFVPIAVGVDRIYAWADPSHVFPVHELRHVEAKRAWLSEPAFVIRSFVYLGVFALASEKLRRWSLRRDGTTPDRDGERALRRERMFAAAMLPPVGLAVTFGAFDWLMSLQPAWFSSMFGIYYFAGGFGAGIAVLAIVASRSPAVPVTPHHFHALGRLLLAFVVFWTYTAYFQGFLIQIANRPVEVTFYLERTRGGWEAVLWAVLIAHFALPFLLLLPRQLKLRPRYVTTVATIVLIGHVLDMLWLVIPSGGDPASPHVADLAALVGIAGACVAFAAWRQRGVPVVPTGDPFVPSGVRYASPT